MTHRYPFPFMLAIPSIDVAGQFVISCGINERLNDPFHHSAAAQLL